MKRLSTSLIAISIALSAATPAHAFKIKPPAFIEKAVDKTKEAGRKVRDSGKKVVDKTKEIGRDVRDAGKVVVDKTVEVAPVVWDEAKDMAKTGAETAVDGAKNAYEWGETAVENGVEVGKFVIENPKDTFQIVRDEAKETWNDVKETGAMIIGSSPEEKRAAAEAAYAEVEPFIPLILPVTRILFDAKDKNEIRKAIQDDDKDRAIRLIIGNSILDNETLRAAKAAGFETVTIGFTLDASLGVGVAFEGGVAIDIDESLAGNHETNAIIYGTYGASGGLSAGGDGGVAISFWKAETTDIHGDAWGALVAANGSVGGGAGVWFAPNRDNVGSVGEFAGFSVGVSGGVSVELGELNYARTRTKNG